ncbi:hypothetical protein CRM22_010957 [Opisthorchis felineus]|uniref:Uncharacterized protein n=1 Tax=Opisthorchis felineus TaxID=147828 RepID=A0A4S2KHT9_OPIFE|nr:hypothetical protein CRM22_010957 [Opisthorchis felineus]
MDWHHQMYVTGIFLVLQFHSTLAGTILHGSLSPYVTECLQDCCEDLEIVEFGSCGSSVQLIPEVGTWTSLRIRFERIHEAYDIAKRRLNLTENWMVVALLLSEFENIQWLLLFRSLEYLITGQPIVGAHVVLPLWHERRRSQRRLPENKWVLYILLVTDYSDLPLDCDDPPTKFALNWITPAKAVILASAEYLVTEIFLP